MAQSKPIGERLREAGIVTQPMIDYALKIQQVSRERVDQPEERRAQARQLPGAAGPGLQPAQTQRTPARLAAATRAGGLGQPVTEFDDLRQAPSHFGSRAARKLRQQGSRAG